MSLKTLRKVTEYIISQTRKEVPFLFICNQQRWPAKTLVTNHNQKGDFFGQNIKMVGGKEGEGTPKSPADYNSSCNLIHCQGALFLLHWAEECVAAGPRALSVHGQPPWGEWQCDRVTGATSSPKPTRTKTHMMAPQPGANGGALKLWIDIAWFWVSNFLN